MTPLAVQRLLALLDAGQDDAIPGVPALPFDLQRLADHGGAPTEAQVLALLGSPGLRQAMRLALLRRASTSPAYWAADEGNAVLTPLGLAAATTPKPPWPQEIRVGDDPAAPVAGVLTVSAGEDANDLYLTLHLQPEAWLGQVAGLRLRLFDRNRQTGTDATDESMVWLEGTTTRQGILAGPWNPTDPGTKPWSRLKKRRLHLFLL